MGVKQMTLSKILKFIGIPILFFIMGWVVDGWRIDSVYKKEYNEQVSQLRLQEDNMNSIEKSYNANKHNYIDEIFNFKKDANEKFKSSNDDSCFISVDGMHYLNAIINKTNDTISIK